MEFVAQLEVEPGILMLTLDVQVSPPLPKHDHVDGGARTPIGVIGSIYKYGHCRDKQNVTRLEIKEKQQPYVI